MTPVLTRGIVERKSPMPAKIFEIKVFKKDREIREINPFLAGVDLDNAEATSDLLNRHLRGAVRRSGGRLDEIHLFHLEVRDITPDGKGRGQALFRWVLPDEVT